MNGSAWRHDPDFQNDIRKLTGKPKPQMMPMEKETAVRLVNWFASDLGFLAFCLNKLQTI